MPLATVEALASEASASLVQLSRSLSEQPAEVCDPTACLRAPGHSDLSSNARQRLLVCSMYMRSVCVMHALLDSRVLRDDAHNRVSGMRRARVRLILQRHRPPLMVCLRQRLRQQFLASRLNGSSC